jgi:hypothetical protein
MTSPLASGTAALQVRTKDGVRFGKELREKDFMFQKGYLNLNHGKCFFSFGMLQWFQVVLFGNN